MLKIQDSVGKGGKNRISDVRKIQTALVRTDFLSPTDYNKECLTQTVETYITNLKNNISDWEVERSANLKDILEGTFSAKENELTATITAIQQFQKKLIPHIQATGTIVPNGRTIQQLGTLSEQMGDGLESNKTFDVVQEGDKITVSLRHEVHKTTKLLSAHKIRNYIVAAYNWNGMIKMLQFAYKNNNDKYLLPNQLTGTESDNLIIIPDQAIIYVIQTQLKQSIKTWGLSQPNLSKILREVDGLPGNSFITKIMEAESKAIFFDESGNESQCTIEDDMNIDVPGLKADSETLYQFFRDMVRCRNGLWSDISGVVNIVGFRRKIDVANKTGYNDTIATCWLEADNSGILKPHVEVTIASTEPGNRDNSRQLVPQTMTLVPGYHHLRQPGGRTRNAVKMGKKNGALVWERDRVNGRAVEKEKDTTMNFHQGNNNFRYPGPSRPSSIRKSWLSKHGIRGLIQHGFPTGGFSQQALHDLNLTLSEVYLILSRYGWDGKTPCYQNLLKMTKVFPVSNDGLANGKINISRTTNDGQELGKPIDIQKAKNWFVNFWYKRRNNTVERAKCAAILKKLKALDDTKAATWHELDKTGLLAVLTDTHINEIVNTQIQYATDWTTIDGLAGPSFYRFANGIRQTVAAAQTDKARLAELFEQLNDFPLLDIPGLIQKFQHHFYIKTDRNRESVLISTQELPEFEADIIKNGTVGDYSLGCQIIYDTEVFYTFWTKLLKRAQAVGQLRWYYTLIDATELKRSDLIA